MANNIHIDTTDLMQVERTMPSAAPSLDQPIKSPFYRGQLPTTAIVNPDAVTNFRTPGIPSYRINPPQPLSLAGAGSNASPTVTVSTFNTLVPPAPTIAQTLVTIPTGYQFSFLQVRLPLGTNTAISTYKVYRSSTSSNTSAQVVQTISHNPANNGVPIVVQDAQTNGVTMFYWVSAVSTAGLESTMTPAQSGTVTSNAGFNSNSQLASTFHNNPVNVAFTPTATTGLSNNGSSTAITVSAGTNQFAPAGISYNSGSVDPGSFGTWYVFADDPQFLGGTVTYQFSSTPPNQTAAEGRLPFGKITTLNGTPKTGGGYTGGTTTGGGGGRGYIG